MGLQRRAHLRSLMNKKSGLSERQSFFHAYFTTTPNKKSYPIADRIFCLISIANFYALLLGRSSIILPSDILTTRVPSSAISLSWVMRIIVRPSSLSS